MAVAVLLFCGGLGNSISCRFLNAFGTHFVRHADMGALYGQQSLFTYDSYTQMEMDYTSVYLYADFSAMKAVGINVSLENGYNETKYSNYVKSRNRLDSYIFGAVPPGKDEQHWLELTIEVSTICKRSKKNTITNLTVM